MITINSLVIAKDGMTYLVTNMYASTSGRIICQLASPFDSDFPLIQRYADTLRVA